MKGMLYMMKFIEMVSIWFYYSFWFMFIAAFVTLVFNRIVKKLWLSPMLLNVIALGVLMFDISQRGVGDGFSAKLNWYFESDFAINIWMYYLPAVFASCLTNVIIFIIRCVKKRYRNT